MITNSKKILIQAYKNKYAIPQFNINNLEWTKYILEECNKNNSPVILGVSESTIKYMGGYKVVVNLIKNLDEELNIKVPVVIHLDHGSSVENCKTAIINGFTSVMYDGSKLPLEQNINNTKQIVEFAKKNNVSVEAEIGCIEGVTGVANENLYAKVEDCEKLVKETNIDSLAPAIGSVHGLYKEKPNLNFCLMAEINKKINIPLVLHGASGIPDNQIEKSLQNGISKVNINTELQIKWANSIREYIKNNDIYDPRKIISSGEEAIKKGIKNKIEILKSNQKQYI